MSTTQCGETSGLVQRLLDEPFRYHFFHAVRLLVRWLGENGIAPDQALTAILRFDNSLSLNFPASQIEALQAESPIQLDTEEAMLHALLDQQLLRIRLTPSFMGLLGSAGTMPRHYTERIADYEAATRDRGTRAFLDMFSNRVVALFYEAWNKYRVEASMAESEDAYLPLLLSIAGYQPGASRNNCGGLNDRVIALYAGLLQQRPMSAVVMQTLLSDYLGAPIAIEESVGHWNGLAESERTSFGNPNAVLGSNAMLGVRNWRPDLRARLRIGPLCKADFDAFLPRTDKAAALKELLGLIGTPTVVYEIEVILRAEDVDCVTVSAQGPGARLGYDSFMVTGPAAAHRNMRYEIRPMAPLPPSTHKRPHNGIRP